LGQNCRGHSRSRFPYLNYIKYVVTFQDKGLNLEINIFLNAVLVGLSLFGHLLKYILTLPVGAVNKVIHTLFGLEEHTFLIAKLFFNDRNGFVYLFKMLIFILSGSL
jgi:hypothetical protein